MIQCQLCIKFFEETITCPTKLNGCGKSFCINCIGKHQLCYRRAIEINDDNPIENMYVSNNNYINNNDNIHTIFYNSPLVNIIPQEYQHNILSWLGKSNENRSITCINILYELHNYQAIINYKLVWNKKSSNIKAVNNLYVIYPSSTIPRVLTIITPSNKIRLDIRDNITIESIIKMINKIRSKYDFAEDLNQYINSFEIKQIIRHYNKMYTCTNFNITIKYLRDKITVINHMLTAISDWFNIPFIIKDLESGIGFKVSNSKLLLIYKTKDSDKLIRILISGVYDIVDKYFTIENKISLLLKDISNRNQL
jgi:hypothetical protein